MPRFLTWHDRFDHERRMALPQCEHCHLRTVHRADCPNYEPPPNLGHWSDLEQRRVYRESVRDLGCRCHWRMPPHTHGLTCPMYRTDEEWADHLATEYHDNARCPTCDSGKRFHRGFPVGGSPFESCQDEWHDLHEESL